MKKRYIAILVLIGFIIGIAVGFAISYVAVISPVKNSGSLLEEFKELEVNNDKAYQKSRIMAYPVLMMALEDGDIKTIKSLIYSQALTDLIMLDSNSDFKYEDYRTTFLRLKPFLEQYNSQNSDLDKWKNGWIQRIKENELKANAATPLDQLSAPASAKATADWPRKSGK
jgi:hypothetical protein